MDSWVGVYDLTSRELLSAGLAAEVAPDAALAARNSGKVALTGAPDWIANFWDAPTLTFKPRVILGDVIVPIVTRAQAFAVVKTLFETNPSAWTATQEKQAIYALLFMAFRDFKTGTF